MELTWLGGGHFAAWALCGKCWTGLIHEEISSGEVATQGSTIHLVVGCGVDNRPTNRAARDGNKGRGHIHCADANLHPNRERPAGKQPPALSLYLNARRLANPADG